MRSEKYLSVIMISLILLVTLTVLGGTNEWTSVGLQGKKIRVISLDPHHSSTIYAGTFYEGLFKSIDEGSSWVELDVPNGSFSSIKFDFNTPGVVYVLKYGGLFKSIDNGGSWTNIYSDAFANVMEIDLQDGSNL